jgi:hypothetical protein
MLTMLTQKFCCFLMVTFTSYCPLFQSLSGRGIAIQWIPLYKIFYWPQKFLANALTQGQGPTVPFSFFIMTSLKHISLHSHVDMKSLMQLHLTFLFKNEVAFEYSVPTL